MVHSHFMLIISIVVICALGNHAVNGRLILLKEEDSELKRQLKMLNKPAVKTIHKEDGDVFDCVDIYKQPSLDHPLLKNHSIQMEPSYYPSSAIDKFSSINKFQNISIGIEGCPEGTVLIRRISKEELLASQYLKNSFSDVKLHWAYIQTNIKIQRDYYGAKVAINVYGLREIKSPQSTHAQIWVIGFKKGLEQDFNTVQAGWHVDPELHGDSQSRLFIHWRNHGYKTPGCVNLLCPGFVQVSKSVAIGTILPVSTFGGSQKEIILSIFQDRSTRNWWLTLDGTKIGYWPKELFNWLSEKARGVIWGGVASAPKNGRTPPMGSGHFANLGDGKAAYFKQAEIIYTPGGGFTPIDPPEQSPYQDAPKCYTVTAPQKVPNVGYHFSFGGPGGC